MANAHVRRATYIRPVGLVPRGGEGDEPRGLPLAGGLFDFSAFEILERIAPDRTARRTTSFDALFERDQGRDVAALAEDVQRLGEPRPRLAGLDLSVPRIMGIVNVTPDSFSDGGALAGRDAAVEHALRLLSQGADIIDIGGESTRPGSDPVPAAVELARVIPVIEGLRARTDAPLSIDTRKASVMATAAAAGCDIINDVSALTFDPEALETAASLARPVVLMHAQGDPKTMQVDPRYDHVALDVFDWLAGRIDACLAHGLPRRLLVVDPGLGFGKTTAHNLELMASLSLFHSLGVPVLVGASRKRFIGELSGVTAAGERGHGSLGAALAAAAQGAQILRVHDVAATRQALDVWMATTVGPA